MTSEELAASVLAELRLLHKGRGIHAGIDRQSAPCLSELSASTADLPPSVGSLISEINTCAQTLPGDLQLAVAAGLGLSAETKRMNLLRDRVIWLSAQLGRSDRVAQRRIDLAERLLATEIAHEILRRRGQASNTQRGWRLDELRAVLRLDTRTPEAHEHRRIIATRDGVTEVTASLDVPRDPDRGRARLDAEILYGGRLIRREQPSLSRFQFIVQFPAPLRAGETHEYGLILRIPEGEPMRPHYVFTPECPCAAFSLRVRFPADRRPRWVRRVEAETVRTFDFGQHNNDHLHPDESGEVQVQFRNPALYLGYGVQWSW